jgi:hypothetical protein
MNQLRKGVLEDKFKEFINENLKREDRKMKYAVVYYQPEDTWEIKRGYNIDFVKNGIMPNNNSETIQLIKDFENKNKVAIDYFIKLDLINKMNPVKNEN